jgi:hypothetical protein
MRAALVCVVLAVTLEIRFDFPYKWFSELFMNQYA